jgi:hypothetical protein
MEATLSERPEYFWYFNNGITIVCSGAQEITQRGRTVLRVNNPQVINGQQTTRVLAAQAELSPSASVLARVIKIPGDSHGEDRFEELVSRIVEATNWQNQIKASDLVRADALSLSVTDTPTERQSEGVSPRRLRDSGSRASDTSCDIGEAAFDRPSMLGRPQNRRCSSPPIRLLHKRRVFRSFSSRHFAPAAQRSTRQGRGHRADVALWRNCDTRPAGRFTHGAGGPLSLKGIPLSRA